MITLRLGNEKDEFQKRLKGERSKYKYQINKAIGKQDTLLRDREGEFCNWAVFN